MKPVDKYISHTCYVGVMVDIVDNLADMLETTGGNLDEEDEELALDGLELIRDLCKRIIEDEED